MQSLPKINNFDVAGKKVILRMDFDVPDGDYSRIEASKETLTFLLQNNAKLILIGHKGRPDGKVDGKYSLSALTSVLEEEIGKKVDFVYDIVGQEVKDKVNTMTDGQIILLENLRFDKREEENDDGFAKELASLADIFVNEAFAVSHRAHTSIVGIPKYLPHAAGMRFCDEIEHLGKVIENPERPLIFLISGIKEDKLKMIENIQKLADKVLVGGRLPEYIENSKFQIDSSKLVVAQLIPDKEDITIHSVEKFADEIGKAKTIVLAGVVGKVEDEGHQQGTKMVFEAVANANAYKIAGGGDTEAALTKFGLTDKFSWVSVGGGAMLEFLAKGTLPGIEVLVKTNI